MHDLLHNIGLAVIGATVLGLLTHALRQPVIIGYFIAGALLGPKIGFGVINDFESINLISEIGLILLLFVIGLEIRLKELLKSGRQLLLSGGIQVPLCLFMGLLVVELCSIRIEGSELEPFYIALLCSLSSTAIVVKLLYDKGEFDTLPGRLTLGILVIQDLYAILILVLQPNLEELKIGPVLRALMMSVALLSFGFLVSLFLLRHIFQSIAKNPEMVVAVSIGWCAFISGLAYEGGLSKEMGALIAGLSISAFPYSIHVTAKTLPLRDFFLTLFFVSLGMRIDAPDAAMIGPVLAVMVIVVLSRFSSVFPALIAAGAGRRAAFITSLNLSQVSEFSLVIGGIGVSLGHIGDRMVGVLMYAMAILAVLSSYAIRYNHEIFQAVEKLLHRTLRGMNDAIVKSDNDHDAPEIVLLGYHRGARSVIDTLSEIDSDMLKRVLVIDFNPMSIEELRMRGVRAIFGDISSLDTLQHAHLEQARFAISTIPDMLLKGTNNAALVRASKVVMPRAIVIATADDPAHERTLRREGADEVVLPHELMGRAIADYLNVSVAKRDAEEESAEAT